VPYRKSKPSLQRQRFGKNLFELRKKLRFTQARLAELADVEWKYIQWLEYGRSWPSLVVLSRLRNALKCDWNDLLEGCEIPDPKKLSATKSRDRKAS
jgi:transcriptional regulator with XRE-family HTH domain